MPNTVIEAGDRTVVKQDPYSLKVDILMGEMHKKIHNALSGAKSYEDRLRREDANR